MQESNSKKVCIGNMKGSCLVIWFYPITRQLFSWKYFIYLYKASVPFILICALVSLLFLEGKAFSKKRGEKSSKGIVREIG